MVKINLLDDDVIVQGSEVLELSDTEEGIVSPPRPLMEQPVFAHETEEVQTEPKGGFDYDILFGGGEVSPKQTQEPKFPSPAPTTRYEHPTIPDELVSSVLFEKEPLIEKPKPPVEVKMEPRTEFRREPIVESRPPVREERKMEPPPRKEFRETFEDEEPRSRKWLYIMAVLLLIGVGTVLVYILRKGPQKPEIATTVSPEEEAKKNAEKQKLALYSAILAQKINNIETLKKVQTAVPDRVEISLASITDTRLYIELTAPSRDEVARFQMNLKRSFGSAKDFDIVYSQDNLPSAGNTLSVTITASVAPPTGGTGVISAFQSSDEILAQYLSEAKRNKLKLIHRTIGKSTVNNGRVPLVMGFRGKKKSVMALLDKLQADNSNFALYKASLATLNPMIPDPRAQVDLFIHLDVLPNQ